jgi:large subunit ribosomal protein L7/L12
MPKVSERERIAALEAKLKQLKVQQQRKEARARTVEARRSRREDVRRRFLVGAVVLAKVEDGSLDKKMLNGWLDPAITRPEDRALFQLDGEV